MLCSAGGSSCREQLRKVEVFGSEERGRRRCCDSKGMLWEVSDRPVPSHCRKKSPLALLGALQPDGGVEWLNLVPFSGKLLGKAHYEVCHQCHLPGGQRGGGVGTLVLALALAAVGSQQGP